MIRTTAVRVRLLEGTTSRQTQQAITDPGIVARIHRWFDTPKMKADK